MSEADKKSSLPSQTKWPNRYRLLAWAITIGGLVAIILLLLYLPVVVEIGLVTVALIAAIATWKYEGFGKGLKFFVKQVLLGL